MKNLITIFFTTLSILALGQELSKKQNTKMLAMEKVLMPLVNNFANDSLNFEERVANIHDFIPRFVTSLKEKNSFNYPFDSLGYVSKIVAPDNAFRIFTWQLKEPLGTHRYYGAIQFNSEDLQMKPLFDYSDTMMYHTQEVLKPNNWYGCLYYNVVMKETATGKKVYTLFGLDQADFVSNRKIMEVMTIEEDQQIFFGAEPIIEYYDSLGFLIEKKNRIFVEYTDKAVLGLNYNLEKEMVVFDHVSPPTEKEKDAKFSYVPDGTYEGFEWKNSKWIWKERVYKYSIGKPDSPPVPMPQNKGGGKSLFGQ